MNSTSTFSQLHLQIWNKNKILRILVPILTYFNTKYFSQHTVHPKTFYPQIGQNGYQKMQNFMLIPNLKMKLRKSPLYWLYPCCEEHYSGSQLHLRHTPIYGGEGGGGGEEFSTY